MSLATRADLERTLLRPLQDPEPEYFQGMLDYIESAILLRAPDILERAKKSAPLDFVLRHVEATAVARVLRMEGGVYTQETEGDYSYTINTAVASGILALLPDEWDLLLGPGARWSSVSLISDDYAQSTFGGDYAWRSVPPGTYNESPRRPFC